MTMPALETLGLAKRYRRRWAVEDCTLSIPRGKIAALVGPNGAGKSTLLRMLAGITIPSAGTISIDGLSLADGPVALERVGYLDQERPLYQGFRVEEMLRFGRELNPRWDNDRAHRQLEELGIPLRERIGKLSGGQQAQVALAMCLAKCAEILLLDEPAAALDPLARDELMAQLLGTVVDDGATVLLSSHAIADLAAICDYVVLLSGGRVQLAEELSTVLDTHRLLVGPVGAPSIAPDGVTIVTSSSTGRQVTLLVRSELSVVAPRWEVLEPSLDEIVLAYLRQNARATANAGAGRGSTGGGSEPAERGAR
ncbi:MAG: transporter, ATP-binding protein [Acidimicrobiaceae bacterium]|jgi:ABC-2 type transport system ATP-binding protein|nr:transporter, ATP-binding protein [Acidimicrobiaceae bacterium]